MIARFLSRRQALVSLLASPIAFKTVQQRALAAPLTVRVGIMAGEDIDIWRIVAANALKNGLIIKTVTFTDYNTPNEALASHDLDANSFQHRPFLEDQIRAHGYKIVPVGDTYVSPIAIYSKKYKSLKDIPMKARIGVPNDPSNEGRALLLLQSLGLLKLASAAGDTPTPLDIIENPRNFEIKELDAGIVGRALPDLDAAVVNTDWARKTTIDLNRDCLAREKLENNPYICVIAVNADDAHKPWVKPLVAAYQQENIHKALIDIYQNTVIPAFK